MPRTVLPAITLKAGTVLHVEGLPVELTADTMVRTAAGNAGRLKHLVAEKRHPESGGVPRRL